MIYFFAITLLAALNPGIDEARSLDFLFADASYYLTGLIVPTASTPTVQADMLQTFLVSVYYQYTYGQSWPGNEREQLMVQTRSSRG